MKFAFSLVAMAVLLILSGCQSTAHDEGTSKGAGQSDTAIYCDKCQTTFTKAPVSGGNPRSPGGVGVIGYRTVAKHECDECRNVAVGVIQQGKSTKPGEIVHECKLCGGTMKVCHTS